MMTARRARAARSGASGFTLIEVMLALAILTFMMTIMWGSFTRTAADKRSIEAAQERLHTVRVALLRMTREIEMAYLSESENFAMTYRRTYYGARDPDDRRILNLMRRETRRLQADDPSAITSEAYVLCPDVSRVKFAFYDHKKQEWESDWSTLNASGNQYLPTHVRITLTVLDERGQEVSYSTDARIQMTEKVGPR